MAGPVEKALAGLDGVAWRSPAPGEWGVSVPDVGGWPLEVGLRVDRGWLRIGAEVVESSDDPWALLHRSRLAVGVRLTASSARAVWVQADLPVAGLCAGLVDEVLGRIVQTAEAVRAGATG